MINCPVYLDQRHPTLADFPINVLGTRSAPSNPRVAPSFMQDVHADGRPQSRHWERRQQQQRVPWFQRRSPRSVTLDSLDMVHPSESRQVGHVETVVPRWNPPDTHMEESDYVAWRRRFTERLLGQEQTVESDEDPQVTMMDGNEHLASLLRQGYAAEIESQQSSGAFSSANSVFQSLHSRPLRTRQAVQRADAIAEAMDLRQTLRRSGRNHNRRRGWSGVRIGSDWAALR